MNKKKINSILRGMAATGIAIGGVSSIQGTDMVYAAELDSTTNETTSENGIASEAHSESLTEAAKESDFSGENSASTSDENIPSENIEDSNNGLTNENPLQDAPDTEAQVSPEDSLASTIASENSALLSESASAEDSLAEAVNSVAEASASASESLTKAESQAASEYESASIANSEYEASLSTAYAESLSAAQSAYDSASTAFESANVKDEYLESLIADIETQKAFVDNLVAENKNVEGATLDNISYTYVDENGNTQTKNYWEAANELANLLVKYSFYQNVGVKSISYSKWEQNSGTGNYVKVEYTDADGATKTAYFDYVTIDSNGKVLYNQDGTANSDAISPSNVAGIAVLQKTPVYNTVSTGGQGGQKPGPGGQRPGGGGSGQSGTTKKVLSGFTYSDDKIYYTTNDGNTQNNGNFERKGVYQYSTEDYNNQRDDYSQQRSEFTSVSHSQSAIKSQSLSEFASRSAYLSESDAAHNSVSESLSASVYSSTLDSDNASTAFSESVSESEEGYKSTSESLSDAQAAASASLSTSLQSTSASISESESGSTYISESTSESESGSTYISESTSESESGSTYISESTSESESGSAHLSESESESE